MTRHQQSQTRAQADRIAQLHREAAARYATGQQAREGMDRADALRRESWGKPATSPRTGS